MILYISVYLHGYPYCTCNTNHLNVPLEKKTKKNKHQLKKLPHNQY